MPLEIVGGLIAFVQTELGISVWDGEVPREDVNGNPINPDGSSTVWPVVCLDMTDGGMQRQQNVGTDPYDDEGTIVVQVWGTGRAQVMAKLCLLENIFVNTTNWGPAGIPIPNANPDADPNNPGYVISMLIGPWMCKQVPNERLSKTQLCYLGRLEFQGKFHGAVNTTQA